MTELRARIEERIRAIAGEIEALVRQEAHDTVAGALRAWVPATNGAPRRKTAKAPSAGAGRPKRTSGRRSPAQMKRDMDALVAYVRAHPGAKMEEVAKANRSSSSQLNRPMHKLVSSGVLRRKGQKRASRYWVK